MAAPVSVSAMEVEDAVRSTAARRGYDVAWWKPQAVVGKLLSTATRVPSRGLVGGPDGAQRYACVVQSHVWPETAAGRVCCAWQQEMTEGGRTAEELWALPYGTGVLEAWLAERAGSGVDERKQIDLIEAALRECPLFVPVKDRADAMVTAQVARLAEGTRIETERGLAIVTVEPRRRTVDGGSGLPAEATQWLEAARAALRSVKVKAPPHITAEEDATNWVTKLLRTKGFDQVVRWRHSGDGCMTLEPPASMSVADVAELHEAVSGELTRGRGMMRSVDSLRRMIGAEDEVDTDTFGRCLASCPDFDYGQVRKTKMWHLRAGNNFDVLAATAGGKTFKTTRSSVTATAEQPELKRLTRQRIAVELDAAMRAVLTHAARPQQSTSRRRRAVYEWEVDVVRQTTMRLEMLQQSAKVQWADVVVKAECGAKGRGVVAARAIPKGADITAYRGDLVPLCSNANEMDSAHRILNVYWANPNEAEAKVVSTDALAMLVNSANGETPNARVVKPPRPIKADDLCNVWYCKLVATRCIQPGEEIVADLNGTELPVLRAEVLEAGGLPVTPNSGAGGGEGSCAGLVVINRGKQGRTLRLTEAAMRTIARPALADVNARVEVTSTALNCDKITVVAAADEAELERKLKAVGAEWAMLYAADVGGGKFALPTSIREPPQYCLANGSQTKRRDMVSIGAVMGHLVVRGSRVCLDVDAVDVAENLAAGATFAEIVVDYACTSSRGLLAGDELDAIDAARQRPTLLAFSGTKATLHTAHSTHPAHPTTAGRMIDTGHMALGRRLEALLANPTGYPRRLGLVPSRRGESVHQLVNHVLGRMPWDCQRTIVLAGVTVEDALARLRGVDRQHCDLVWVELQCPHKSYKAASWLDTLLEDKATAELRMLVTAASEWDQEVLECGWRSARGTRWEQDYNKIRKVDRHFSKDGIRGMLVLPEATGVEVASDLSLNELSSYSSLLRRRAHEVSIGRVFLVCGPRHDDEPGHLAWVVGKLEKMMTGERRRAAVTLALFDTAINGALDDALLRGMCVDDLAAPPVGATITHVVVCADQMTNTCTVYDDSSAAGAPDWPKAIGTRWRIKVQQSGYVQPEKSAAHAAAILAKLANRKLPRGNEAAMVRAEFNANGADALLEQLDRSIADGNTDGALVTAPKIAIVSPKGNTYDHNVPCHSGWIKRATAVLTTLGIFTDRWMAVTAGNHYNRASGAGAGEVFEMLGGGFEGGVPFVVVRHGLPSGRHVWFRAAQATYQYEFRDLPWPHTRITAYEWKNPYWHAQDFNDWEPARGDFECGRPTKLFLDGRQSKPGAMYERPPCLGSVPQANGLYGKLCLEAVAVPQHRQALRTIFMVGQANATVAVNQSSPPALPVLPLELWRLIAQIYSHQYAKHEDFAGKKLKTKEFERLNVDPQAPGYMESYEHAVLWHKRLPHLYRDRFANDQRPILFTLEDVDRDVAGGWVESTFCADVDLESVECAGRKLFCATGFSRPPSTFLSPKLEVAIEILRRKLREHLVASPLYYAELLGDDAYGSTNSLTGGPVDYYVRILVRAGLLPQGRLVARLDRYTGAMSHPWTMHPDRQRSRVYVAPLEDTTRPPVESLGAVNTATINGNVVVYSYQTHVPARNYATSASLRLVICPFSPTDPCNPYHGSREIVSPDDVTADYIASEFFQQEWNEALQNDWVDRDAHFKTATKCLPIIVDPSNFDAAMSLHSRLLPIANAAGQLP